MVRELVIVSGAPGSGKTTLAEPLARILGFQLITKDRLKEALDDAVNPLERDLAWSRLTGGMAFQAMWQLATHFSGVILEANFYPSMQEHRDRILGLNRQPVEVFCSCPARTALMRYRARAGARHRVHVESDLPIERFREWEQPMGLGPVITVDTSLPFNPELVATNVRQLLSGLPPESRFEAHHD